jgi:hypothetical protein
VASPRPAAPGWRSTLYGTESLLMLLNVMVLAGDWDDALAVEARVAQPHAGAAARCGLRAAAAGARRPRPARGLALAHRLAPLARADLSGSHIVLAPRPTPAVARGRRRRGADGAGMTCGSRTTAPHPWGWAARRARHRRRALRGRRGDARLRDDRRAGGLRSAG